MKKITLELTGMNQFQRCICDFCGLNERNIHYSIRIDGIEIGWYVCEECFSLFKINPSKVFEMAYKVEKYHPSGVEKMKRLKYLSMQKIDIIGRKNFAKVLYADNEMRSQLQEENDKYGTKVYCSERCGNCDGNPGDRHLPGCLQMTSLADAEIDGEKPIMF